MKNIISLIALLLSSVVAVAQVAIINDQDGYTNVRKEPNGQAEIIHKVYANEAFWYNLEEGNGEWVTVYIPKNDFSLGSSNPEYLQGFIHKSRLQLLEKIPVYKGADFKFKYTIEPFVLKDRIVDRYEGRAVVAINGRPVWGSDGDFPKTQVKAISVTVEGKEIPISKALFGDIYECTNSFNVYKNGDTYFVYQWNSDGAGGYQIVWAFTKEGLKQRLVGSMI